ncbi:MAG: patatin-like phospholipase family protein [Pseudomonadota bacterium]
MRRKTTSIRTAAEIRPEPGRRYAAAPDLTLGHAVMHKFLGIRSGIALGAVLGLAACGAPSIKGPTCTGLVRAFDPAVSTTSRSDASAIGGDLFSGLFEAQAGQNAILSRDGRRIPIEILAMTTGGQYGSFSSGALFGWPDTDKPAFNVVTGASAGALIAPLAFAGSEFDSSLPSNTGINTDDILTRNPLLALPVSSSVYSTAKLKRRVGDQVSAKLISRIAQRARPGANGVSANTVAVGAVNLNNGRFDVLDIGQYLATTPDDEQTKKDCVTEAVLASSAIPVLFPPRRINGDLYADAGVRQHVFLEKLAEGQRVATQRTGQAFDVRVTLLVNGDLVVDEQDQKTGIISLAERNFELVTDQGFRDSIDRTIRVVRQNKNWDFRALVAPVLDPNQCKDADPLFDACITQALFDAGRNMTSARPIQWLDADGLAQEINKIYEGK